MKFGSNKGYMSSTMWLTAMILQLFTQRFCRKYWTHDNDPSGGMFDQMTRAARSVTANIAEGLSRHQTSKETEMRLLDVARGSLSELFSDYYFLLLDNNLNIWPRNSEPTLKFDELKILPPTYKQDWSRESMAYINGLTQVFAPWCENQYPEVAINSLMLLIDRLQQMAEHKMNSLLDVFKNEGGFTESLTRERVDQRNLNAIEAGAPSCPECGKPMLRRYTKAGVRQGEQFWGCCDYPRCRATRPIQ